MTLARAESVGMGAEAEGGVTAAGGPGTSAAPLLDVSGLRTEFATSRGVVAVVRDISFQLRRGETLGIIGESGSGKSMTCQSLLGLVSKPGRVVGGRAMFDGQDLLAMSERERRGLLGSRIGTILQDPMTALNPAFSIGEQVGEVLRIHRRMRGRQLVDRVVEVLGRVKIPMPAKRLGDYPHLLSGGMRQRVVAASAIACGPDLLIADEPTTALDVTTQAHFLDLLRAIQRDTGLAIIFVTHDFGVVRRLCDRVAVMYGGRIVETGETAQILQRPRHPYTQALLASIPDIDEEVDRLRTIPGQPPSAREFDDGCAFRTRCGFATERCQTAPPLRRYSALHQASCWREEAHAA